MSGLLVGLDDARARALTRARRRLEELYACLRPAVGAERDDLLARLVIAARRTDGAAKVIESARHTAVHFRTNALDLEALEHALHTFGWPGSGPGRLSEAALGRLAVLDALHLLTLVRDKKDDSYLSNPALRLAYDASSVELGVLHEKARHQHASPPPPFRDWKHAAHMLAESLTRVDGCLYPPANARGRALAVLLSFRLRENPLPHHLGRARQQAPLPCTISTEDVAAALIDGHVRISGASGTGKSDLLRSVAARALAGSPSPYALVIELPLSKGVRDFRPARAAPPEITGDAETDAVLAAFRWLGDRPPILWVLDAHHVDTHVVDGSTLPQGDRLLTTAAIRGAAARELEACALDAEQVRSYLSTQGLPALDAGTLDLLHTLRLPRHLARAVDALKAPGGLTRGSGAVRAKRDKWLEACGLIGVARTCAWLMRHGPWPRLLLSEVVGSAEIEALLSAGVIEQTVRRPDKGSELVEVALHRGYLALASPAPSDADKARWDSALCRAVLKVRRTSALGTGLPGVQACLTGAADALPKPSRAMIAVQVMRVLHGKTATHDVPTEDHAGPWAGVVAALSGDPGRALPEPAVLDVASSPDDDLHAFARAAAMLAGWIHAYQQPSAVWDGTGCNVGTAEALARLEQQACVRAYAIEHVAEIRTLIPEEIVFASLVYFFPSPYLDYAVDDECLAVWGDEFATFLLELPAEHVDGSDDVQYAVLSAFSHLTAAKLGREQDLSADVVRRVSDRMQELLSRTRDSHEVGPDGGLHRKRVRLRARTVLAALAGARDAGAIDQDVTDASDTFERLRLVLAQRTGRDSERTRLPELVGALEAMIRSTTQPPQGEPPELAFSEQVVVTLLDLARWRRVIGPDVRKELNEAGWPAVEQHFQWIETLVRHVFEKVCLFQTLRPGPEILLEAHFAERIRTWRRPFVPVSSR